MEKISLVVVDDHPLFRQGVVDVFALEPLKFWVTLRVPVKSIEHCRMVFFQNDN